MHYVPFTVLFSATRATVVFMDTDRGFKGGEPCQSKFEEGVDYFRPPALRENSTCNMGSGIKCQLNHYFPS